MAECLLQQQPECHRHAQEFCAEAFAGPAAGKQQQQHKPAQPQRQGQGQQKT